MLLVIVTGTALLLATIAVHGVAVLWLYYIGIRPLIPIVTEADSRDSQKPANLNRWRKQEVCDGFSNFFTVRF